MLRERLHQLSDLGEEDARLSTFALTARLTRLDATKLFFQICVTASNNFVRAQQDTAYGDIILRPGPCL